MGEEAARQPDDPARARTLSGRIGKYEIVRPLGRGAMGVVYLAHDTVLERDVALKVMSAQIADDPELKQRFEREAKAVARMTHPNVVSVFDLGQHVDGSHYITMELLKGQDLQKTLRTQPPLSLDRKLGVVLQALAGLHHAHQAGIVHRDIKPANIFLNADGSVKIMDFGVARLTSAPLTGTGSVVGTADYMSPEQVKGAKVDGRSDLFSVGAVLFELLTGRRPFHADTLMAIFYKITHDEPDYDVVPAGAEYDALLPILRRALAKNLGDRYPSAYEFAQDLRAHLAAYASTNSGRHALEHLVSLDAPTAPPGPNAQAAPTLVDGESGSEPWETGLLASRSAARQPTLPMTAPPTEPVSSAAHAGRAAATLPAPVSGAAGRPTLRAPVGSPRPRPAVAPRAAPRPAAATRPVALYVVLGLVVLGGAGAWLVSRSAPPSPAPAPPAPSVVPVVNTAAASAAPVSVPPAAVAEVESAPTPAPAPRSAATEEPDAAPLRAAKAAFARGDYERALAAAEAALRADPQDSSARTLADSARQGRTARARVVAGEAALAQGDLDRAQAESDAARAVAPWDERAAGLAARVGAARENAAQQARDAARRQAAGRIDALLDRGDAALASRDYDAALGFYEQALALDPQNTRASIGRTGTLAARAAQGAPAAAPGHAFAAGRTSARAPGARVGGSLPAGFEDSPEVAVKKASQAADLPGQIHFEVSPATVKPGERYTVRIALLNEGTAPIRVARLTVTTSVNGRKSSGPVTPTAKDVAPQQKAVLHAVSDLWSDETTSWSMEVALTTARGEQYTNQLTWK